MADESLFMAYLKEDHQLCCMFPVHLGNPVLHAFVSNKLQDNGLFRLIQIKGTQHIFIAAHTEACCPLLLMLTSAKCSFCSETINASQCWGAQAD